MAPLDLDSAASAGPAWRMAETAPPARRSSPRVPCVAVEAETATFALFPPAPFALDMDNDRYKLLLPYGAAAADVAVGGGPCVRRRLRPGDLVLAEPSSHLIARHVEPLEFLLVTMTAERARSAAVAAAGESWLLDDRAQWHDPGVAALGQEMRRALMAEALPAPGYLAALADALVARVAVALATEHRRGLREPIAPAALARVARHIEASLAEPIEVADLARVAGLSPAHFARVFAKATGDTPHRFVMKRRVCRARDLLSGSDASIAEVAVRAGFASQAHMSTAFRREVGLSPARYRAAFQDSDGRGG